MGWFWNNCTVIFYLFKRLPVVILTGFNDKSATSVGKRLPCCAFEFMPRNRSLYGEIGFQFISCAAVAVI